MVDEFNAYNFGKPTDSAKAGSWWVGKSRDAFREAAAKRNETLRVLYGHAPVATPPTDTEQRYMNRVGAR